MRVAVYIILKDEARILEFVNYYLKIGVDFFIFLDDNSIDINLSEIMCKNNIAIDKYIIYNTKDICMDETELKKCHFKHEAKSSFFLRKYLKTIVTENNIDFIMQFDADEFLFLKNRDIHKTINMYLQFDILKINWLVFGSNHLFNNYSDSIIKSFNKSNIILHPMIKSITNVESIDFDAANHSAHFLTVKNKNPVIKNILNECIFDDSSSVIIENVNLSKLNIYLAHFVNQDFNTFIKRKIIRLQEFKHLEIDIDKKIEFLYNNVSEFSQLIYNKIYNIDTNHNNNNLQEKFTNIPIEFINYLCDFFIWHDNNNILNNDILDIYLEK